MFHMAKQTSARHVHVAALVDPRIAAQLPATSQVQMLAILGPTISAALASELITSITHTQVSEVVQVESDLSWFVFVHIL